MITFPISTESTPVVGPPQGQWTFAHWETLPHDNGNRYEVIDGVLYASSVPSVFHQWIIGRLIESVAFPAEDNKQGYCGFARVGVIMPGCDPVQPDFFHRVTKSRLNHS